MGQALRLFHRAVILTARCTKIWIVLFGGAARMLEDVAFWAREIQITQFAAR
jgi:hypothetical protein